MKNLFFALISVSFFCLASCKDDCTTCSGMDPIFGIEISSEACDNGDGTVTVSGTALGITSDTTFVGTLETFRSENIADGFTCD